jgi:hypothetical protein
MNTYPITHDEKGQELNIIREIREKYYHQQVIHPKQQQQKRLTNNSQEIPNSK